MLSGIHRNGTAFESLEPRALLGAHLLAKLSPVTEGRDGRLTVVATITNNGDRFYRGGDKVDFFLSPDPAIHPYSRSGSDIAAALSTRTLPPISAHGKAKFSLTFSR